MTEQTPTKTQTFANAQKLERLAKRAALIERSRDTYAASLQWAKRVGYSEGKAPLAAVVAQTLKVQHRGRPVTKTEVDTRLEQEGRL